MRRAVYKDYIEGDDIIDPLKGLTPAQLENFNRPELDDGATSFLDYLWENPDRAGNYLISKDKKRIYLIDNDRVAQHRGLRLNDEKFQGWMKDLDSDALATKTSELLVIVDRYLLEGPKALENTGEAGKILNQFDPSNADDLAFLKGFRARLNHAEAKFKVIKRARSGP